MLTVSCLFLLVRVDGSQIQADPLSAVEELHQVSGSDRVERSGRRRRARWWSFADGCARGEDGRALRDDSGRVMKDPELTLT